MAYKHSKKKKKSYIKRDYSRDTLRRFTWNKNNATVYPDFSFQSVLNMVNTDPIARGALTHFVDKCMEGEYNVIKKDSLSYDRDFELLLDEKYMFRQKILRPWFKIGKLFNNVFVEIIRDTTGRMKGLNILDSMNVEPITEPNGDPIKYRSKIPNAKTGEYPEWSKEDIVWFKYGDISQGYAPTDLRALWENLLSKEYVKRYVAWLWKTGQYRLIYNPKSASDKDIEDFLAYAKRHDDNYKVPFIIKGDLETKILRDVKETESIDLLLKYYDNQTLVLMRVLPIDAGIPDASGRSNADAQSNNFATHVISFKKAVEDTVNFDLFPKINKGNTMLKFSAHDRFAEKQIFENIQIMKSLGMSNDVVKEYLGDRGMFFKSQIFDPVPEQIDMNNPRDKDTAPSRTGKGEGEANQNQEEVTTRQDQVKKVDE